MDNVYKNCPKTSLHKKKDTGKNAGFKLGQSYLKDTILQVCPKIAKNCSNHCLIIQMNRKNRTARSTGNV